MKAIDERRALVRTLAGPEMGPARIAEMLAERGVTNPHTGKPYHPRTIRADMKAMPPAPEPVVIAEMIGREALLVDSFWPSHASTTADATRTDYKFWDRLRHGKAEGFEFGGLFAKPICEIVASWVIGELPTVTLLEPGEAGVEDDPRNYTDRMIERFLLYNHALLMTTVEDKYGLGDQWIIINPDGSLSVPSPDTVSIDVDPTDYRRVVKVTITTKFRGVKTTDEYTEKQRRVTVEEYPKDPKVTTYTNLLGRIPVVHWPNDRRGNELFGRVLYEPMFRLFSRFDSLIEKALNGVELVGNPIPVFEGMENVAETIAANSVPDTEQYAGLDGSTVTRNVIAFDTLSAIFVGKGGSFSFKAPAAGFTEDITAMLRMLFLLICNFARIPEFLWGGAVEASKASTETQMPPFVQYIQSMQVKLAGQGTDEDLGLPARGGLYELIDVWLRMKALRDRKIVVDTLQVEWPDMTAEAAQIKLQKIIYADSQGYLPRGKALGLLKLVANAAKVIAQADREVAMRPPDETEDWRTQMNAAAHKNAQPGVDEDDDPKVTDTPESAAGGIPGERRTRRTAA